MSKPTAETVKRDLEDRFYNVAFVALVGSQCKGLADENSDYDYKAWIVPTLDDLYYGVRITTRILLSNYDVPVEVEVKDIRDLDPILRKQGSNYLDMLWSEDTYYADNFAFIEYFASYFFCLDPKRAYQAAIGMLNQKMKMCEKDLTWKNLIQARSAYDQANFIDVNHYYKTYVSDETYRLKREQEKLNLEEEYEVFKGKVDDLFKYTYEGAKKELERFSKRGPSERTVIWPEFGDNLKEWPDFEDLVKCYVLADIRGKG